MLLMSEIWKSHPIHDAYKVSDNGRVMNEHGFIYKNSIGSHGYYAVSVKIDGKHTKALVHRLVCEAFYGLPRDPGLCVNHLDGNKLNNTISNLEWTTIAENNRHAQKSGIAHPPPIMRGVNNVTSKLTAHQVREIRSNPWLLTGVELAKKYGVAPQTISAIRTGNTWRESQYGSEEPTRKAPHPRSQLTHCKHGHEFTDENTIHRKTGGRSCRTCMRKAWREYSLRKKI
jgi:hypothetical protein